MGWTQSFGVGWANNIPVIWGLSRLSPISTPGSHFNQKRLISPKNSTFARSGSILTGKSPCFMVDFQPSPQSHTGVALEKTILRPVVCPLSMGPSLEMISQSKWSELAKAMIFSWRCHSCKRCNRFLLDDLEVFARQMQWQVLLPLMARHVRLISPPSDWRIYSPIHHRFLQPIDVVGVPAL